MISYRGEQAAQRNVLGSLLCVGETGLVGYYVAPQRRGVRSWGICRCSELLGRQDWACDWRWVTGPPVTTTLLWTGEGAARAALLNAGLAWPWPDKAAGRNRLEGLLSSCSEPGRPSASVRTLQRCPPHSIPQLGGFLASVGPAGSVGSHHLGISRAWVPETLPICLSCILNKGSS